MIDIHTTRFGRLRVQEQDLISFPKGLLGMEHLDRWVLLTDASNDSLGWLQSASDPRVAVAIVSPRRFVGDYQVRLSPSELAPLNLDDVNQAQVMVVVGKSGPSLTLNLKAPLVINPEDRLGRQVIVSGDWPIRYELSETLPALRKSA